MSGGKDPPNRSRRGGRGKWGSLARWLLEKENRVRYEAGIQSGQLYWDDVAEWAAEAGVRRPDGSPWDRRRMSEAYNDLRRRGLLGGWTTVGQPGQPHVPQAAGPVSSQQGILSGNSPVVTKSQPTAVPRQPPQPSQGGFSASALLRGAPPPPTVRHGGQSGEDIPKPRGLDEADADEGGKQ